MKKNIRVVAFDDCAIMLDSLEVLMQVHAYIKMVGKFRNCNFLEQRITVASPDVVLMDIEMPGVNGIEGLKRIKLTFPLVEVIMLTMFEEDERILESIRNGASGYLLKKSSPDKIIEAIENVHAGGVPMTASIARRVLQLFPKAEPAVSSTSDLPQLSVREREVLQYLVKGLSCKMIAGEMNISMDTVRSHNKRIYSKLQVNSVTQAVAKAIKGRIV